MYWYIGKKQYTSNVEHKLQNTRYSISFQHIEMRHNFS